MDNEKNLVPQEEQQNLSIQSTEDNAVEMESAGAFGLIASALFPLIGIIIFFVQRKEVKNPSAYLIAALIGFVISFVMRLAVA